MSEGQAVATAARALLATAREHKRLQAYHRKAGKRAMKELAALEAATGIKVVMA